ncbi:hypothetical protein CMUS01_10330 [Colletotrichum musicola]|uniref:Uncharacterized protein n=1 Tax=Colletotrichum musicola TaxID=2175873 RepID=A0A8H6K3L6_9PEZI|nr:hypothetical protein CMUS01_10330 [Colletotrichum musicola]
MWVGGHGGVLWSLRNWTVDPKQRTIFMNHRQQQSRPTHWRPCHTAAWRGRDSGTRETWEMGNSTFPLLPLDFLFCLLVPPLGYSAAMVLGVSRPILAAMGRRQGASSGTAVIGVCSASPRCSYAAWSMHPASFRSAVQSAFAGMSGLCLIDVALTAHCSARPPQSQNIRVSAYRVRVYAWLLSRYRFSHGRSLPLWDVRRSINW